MTELKIYTSLKHSMHNHEGYTLWKNQILNLIIPLAGKVNTYVEIYLPHFGFVCTVRKNQSLRTAWKWLLCSECPVSSQGLCGAAPCIMNPSSYTQDTSADHWWETLAKEGHKLKAQKMNTCATTGHCVRAHPGHHWALQHCSFLLSTAICPMSELFIFSILIKQKRN